MKYFKTQTHNKQIKKKYLPVLFFIIIICFSAFKIRDTLSRSIFTVTLGSLYIEFLNEKAELINFVKNNKLNTVELRMSPNNFVRLQKERAKMASNFIITGEIFNPSNKTNYYPVRVNDSNSNSKGEIKLFGWNIDHFRDSDGHSFRIKFNGGSGYGNQKFNFINPRSRDFITDPLMNLIFKKLYKGIQITYEPVQVLLNKINYGILYKESFFDKYLIENNQRRESVIFEIVGDSIHYNHLGKDDVFLPLANQIKYEYLNNYDLFLEKINLDLAKAVILFSIITKDAHPLAGVNLHWYFNPASGLYEPTYRENFAYPIDKNSKYEIEKSTYTLLNSNKILKDLYNLKLKKNFENYLSNQLSKIDSFIKADNDYKSLKNKMIGFSRNIDDKEKIILENIKILKTNLNEEKYPNVKNSTEKIVINKDTLIKNNLTIKPNQELIIKKGVNLTLLDSYVRIYGKFEALGEKNHPINIKGIGTKKGTIYFNSDKKININYVNFESLSNLNSTFSQPASITFYECNNIVINNSSFKNNKSGDDFVNFFRSKNTSISNSSFSNILSDAIDSDFSELQINGVTFDNIGNDGLDGSESFIKISNSYFLNVKDKAISAGEKSEVKVIKCEFINNEIALVVKDQSKLYSENNILINNRLDFTSFKKKKIFFQPSSNFINTNIKNYLIEEGSKVLGLKNIIFIDDVESKLYGNIYGKSSK
jgi:hypothetical protein